MNGTVTRTRRTMFSAACASAAIPILLSGGTAQGQCLTQHLFASDGAAGDGFGGGTAISGDTIIIGASRNDTVGGVDAGSAYIFVRGGSEWVQQAQLLANDGAAGDRLGLGVAISGDTAIVGAYQDDTPAGLNAGSAYVFVRNAGIWTQQAKLVAPDGAVGNWMGWAVAISGDTAIVGAPNRSAAYVFVRGGGVWTLQATLARGTGILFGSSVSISGETAVIGAPNDHPEGSFREGSAYVFVRGIDGLWEEQAYLRASDASEGDSFGWESSISGDTIVVGAPGSGAGNGSRSSYVYVRGGGTWTEQARLSNPTGRSDTYFGDGVAVSGERAIVGAVNDDTSFPNSGAAFVYERSGDSWSLVAPLPVYDSAMDDSFGWGTAIDGETLVVGAALDDTAGGANAGSAYVYNLSSPPLAGDINGSGWTDLSDLTILLANFGGLFGMSYGDGDLDGDHDVDVSDLSLFLADFGRHCP